MRIAVCDNDAFCINQYMSSAKQYAATHTDMNVDFDYFSHPDDLIEAAERIGGYDIYILDIVLPDINGIALGKKLRDAGYDGKIIYFTCNVAYSLDAFRVRAFDYLLKPIDTDTFCWAIDEAAAQISINNDKYLLVKTKDRRIKLAYDSIMYAELNHRAITYYLADGRVIESVSLRSTFANAIAELLCDKRFNLCSVGMVVNLDHITEIENEAVVFGRKYRSFLGVKYCRKLRRVWSNYILANQG